MVGLISSKWRWIIKGLFQILFYFPSSKLKLSFEFNHGRFKKSLTWFEVFETFLTLRAIVVILDDELYQAVVWCKILVYGLIRKYYVRNLILIESAIYLNLLDIIVKILSVWRHLFLSILIRGREVSLLSKNMTSTFSFCYYVYTELNNRG